jgi:hypothetical protein
MIGPVLIRAVQEVGVKKNGISGFHLTIYQFQSLQARINPFHICSSLIACQDVIDPAHLV